jgi:hypothetical protein
LPKLGYLDMGIDSDMALVKKTFPSGRNTVRAALGGEFPTCTLSVCAVGS